MYSSLSSLFAPPSFSSSVLPATIISGGATSSSSVFTLLVAIVADGGRGHGSAAPPSAAVSRDLVPQRRSPLPFPLQPHVGASATTPPAMRRGDKPRRRPSRGARSRSPLPVAASSARAFPVAVLRQPARGGNGSPRPTPRIPSRPRLPRCLPTAAVRADASPEPAPRSRSPRPRRDLVRGATGLRALVRHDAPATVQSAARRCAPGGGRTAASLPLQPRPLLCYTDQNSSPQKCCLQSFHYIQIGKG